MHLIVGRKGGDTAAPLTSKRDCFDVHRGIVKKPPRMRASAARGLACHSAGGSARAVFLSWISVIRPSFSSYARLRMTTHDYA